MSLNGQLPQNIWESLERYLPWSLAPDYSPLERVYERLSRFRVAKKITPRLLLLLSSLVVVGVLEPLFGLLSEHANDWTSTGGLVLSRLLFCASLGACEWITEWTAKRTLADVNTRADVLQVKPSIKQLEFTAYLVGSVIVLGLLGNDVVTLLKGAKQFGNIGDPSPSRFGPIGMILDGLVWFVFLLPTGARWLGTVWGIALNAAAITTEYFGASSDYLVEKMRRTANLRSWFDRQVGLLIGFFVCALPKLYLERALYAPEAVLWLLALTFLGLLSLPPVAIFYVMSRYRTRALDCLAKKLATTAGTENDRLDYFGLRTIREPFSEWFLVGSLVASAGGAISKAYTGSIKFLPSVPIISHYLEEMSVGLRHHRLGTAFVGFFGIVVIALYARQVSIDLKRHDL